MPSAVIRWIRYEPDTRRLLVGFQTGRRYAYEDVPPAIHAAFRAAPSRGAYFNDHIRDRFAYSRMDADDVDDADTRVHRERRPQ